MASIQSPVSFTGNLVTKPTASDLLRSSSNGVCGVPLNSLGKAQLGAKRRDVTAMAKIRRVRKHEYPWPRNPTPNVEGGPLIHLSSFKPLTDRPKPVTLEFEKPLLEMQKTMNDVQKMMNETGLDMSGHLQELEKKYQQKMKAMYTNLTPIQRVHIARHPDRPTFLDHIFNITDKFIELHGDRAGFDDPAIVTGLGSINGRTYMFIGHQKGRNTKENIQRNFGMPTPHGYRKALRLMNYADHHGFPIVTFVDTPGAYADLKSEELGQGEAIAYNLRAMYGLKVPVVSIVIGEGGSGGALAIACANKLLMLENAVFYVASPEACAAILYKSAKAAPKAAKVLKITAGSLTKIGICDGVIPEPLGGAHADPHWTSQQLKTAIVESVDELLKMDTETLLKHRAAKVRGIGRGITSLNVDPKKKRNMRKSDVPPVEVELRATVDKLRQKHIEAFRNAIQLPTTDLEKMIVTLKKDTDAYYVEAAKVLGYKEKFTMLREKIVKARKVALTTPPALTEELEKLKREFRRKIPLTPDYPSLKAKLDMVKDLRETLYIASLRDNKPIEKLERVKDVLMSSGLRAKGKLAMKKLADAREIPDDEESKAKIVAIHEEMQKAILEVMEKIEKIEGPPAGAANTEDDPSNRDAEVLLDESLAPVEDESLPHVENGIVPHVEDESFNPVEDESFPPKVSVEA